MNYFVICCGHVSFFEQYEAALEMAYEFDGRVYNLWGLTSLE